MRAILLPLESVVVYPKELARDDFATVPAVMAEAVEVDHFRQGYFQIPSLHSAHFLFATYIVHIEITLKQEIFYNMMRYHMPDIPEDRPAGF